MNLFALRFTALAALSFTLLAASGCRTTPTNLDGGALSKKIDTESPFLRQGDFSDGLDDDTRRVLDEHGFSVPWIALRGPRSSRCFVAERFQSVHRFDRVYVRISPAGDVTAEISAYQFGPSDWSTLGLLFADFSQEANSIASEIAKKRHAFGSPAGTRKFSP